jgi:tripartite-type tricarboxylate transporter receptor subunit TctC
MNRTSKSLLRICAGALACLFATVAAPQAYPSRPVTVVVPYAVGGTTDIVARLVGQTIGNGLGQPLVVDNKTGAGGAIGWGTVARAAPDGYTLLTTEMSLAVAPALQSQLPFDARKGFAHVTTAASAPHVLVVNPEVPAKTLHEFIAYARANPGKLNYGSGGNGTNTHLGGELFKREAGVSLVHIPYKGAGAVLQDLMGGQVQALVTSVPTALPHIKSGKLRALVVTSSKRSALLPDVPAASEAGLPRFVMDFWVGFAAPSGTPAPIVEQLNKAVVAAVHSEEGRKRLAEQGLVPIGNSPAVATRLVQDETVRWGAVVKAAGIKAE